MSKVKLNIGDIYKRTNGTGVVKILRYGEKIVKLEKVSGFKHPGVGYLLLPKAIFLELYRKDE
jgi:hypothetical protein